MALFNDFFSSSNPINEPDLSLDSIFWKELEGGYRKVKYDASAALKKLKDASSIEDVNVVYKELWDELHHQGDVGLASYYAVPHLVQITLETNLIDYNVLGLVTVIEVERHKNNPLLPQALEPAYREAVNQLPKIAEIAMTNDSNLELVSIALASIAVAKGQIKLADALIKIDGDDMIDEFLEKY